MKKVQLIAIEEGKSNPVNTSILDCVEYWNREGSLVIENNKSGKWGDEETKKGADTMDADDFILGCILSDCQIITDRKTGYECGRTRSHVWVHFNDERILMIHA